MTFTTPAADQPDPFDMTAQIDPDQAANVMGILLRVMGEEGGSEQASTGILSEPEPVTPETGTAAKTATEVTSTGTSNPVPSGYTVSGEYGEDRGGKKHGGIDLGIPVGTTVVAAGDGKITSASNSDPGGYGNLVEIQLANGVKLRYGHLSHIGATVGQEVKAGQPIGKSGGAQGAPGAGNSKGPHLHFEVDAPGGATMDPHPYLAGGNTIIGGVPDLNDPNPVITDPTEQVGTVAANIPQMLAGKAPTHSTAEPVASATSTQTAGDPSTADGYFAGVLTSIGAPVTSANLQFMRAWMKAEGGSADNPFNTTEGAPGATNFNSVGVKRYPSPQVGMQATIKTLMNGRYGNIIAALKAGNDPMAAARALAASPWGTGALVMKILGGG